MPVVARRFALRGGLVLVVALAAACSSDRGTLTAPSFGVSATTVVAANVDIASVAMVGDSITAGSTGPLEDGFRNLGLEVRAIDAANGRRITADGGAGDSGLGAVATLGAAGPPDLWVIALGSNDVLQYAGAEEYRDQIATLLGTLPSDVPVVWVDTYLEEDPARSEEFNRALRDTLAFRGSATVADWAAVAPGDGVLRDGIHPSEAGTQLFADVVMSAVEQWLG